MIGGLSFPSPQLAERRGGGKRNKGFFVIGHLGFPSSSFPHQAPPISINSARARHLVQGSLMLWQTVRCALRDLAPVSFLSSGQVRKLDPAMDLGVLRKSYRGDEEVKENARGPEPAFPRWALVVIWVIRDSTQFFTDEWNVNYHGAINCANN